MQYLTQNQKQKILKRVAPDAFILVNGLPWITGADGSRVNFNDSLTTISINGSIDAPPATANFTIVVPRYERAKYFQNERAIFQNMMEVQIFIKGRYYTQNEDGSLGLPLPYQQFHGLITSITDDYGSDQHNIHVSCHDMLYWMKITKMASHPSVLYSNSTGTPCLPFAAVFNKMHPKKIIHDVVNMAFGGVQNNLSNQSTTNNASSNNSNKIISAVQVGETFGAQSFSIGIGNVDISQLPQSQLVSVQKNLLAQYWQTRFKLTADNTTDTNVLSLLIYNYRAQTEDEKNKDQTNAANNASQVKAPDNTTVPKVPGTAGEVAPAVKQDKYGGEQFGGAAALQAAQATSQAGQQGGTVTSNSLEDAITQLINDAHPFGELAQIEVSHTEYSSLLDIAIHVRDYVGYEFYMSLDGKIIFKPPFYNIDVKAFRPFVIKDEDVVTWNFTESDDVITFMSVRGNISDLNKFDSTIQEMASVFDANLATQYGIRAQQVDLEMSANLKNYRKLDVLALYGQNEMDRHNAKRFQGSITIVGTPEIKLGWPVYIESKDCYAYVTAINHNFNFGTSFQTTLTVEALRFFSTNPPNFAMAPGDTSAPYVNNSGNQKVEDLHLAAERNGYRSGTGVKIDKTRNLVPVPDQPDPFYKTQVQRVTDLDGYELIGVIGYGRNILLMPDGTTLPKTGALNLNTETAFTNDVAQKMSSMKPQTANTNVVGSPNPTVIQPKTQTDGAKATALSEINAAPTTQGNNSL